MSSNSRSRGLVFWLFACLLAHCGGDASDPPRDTGPGTLCELFGNVPCDDGVMTSGTETGNPPSIQLKKLYLLASPLGVAVVGEPGAIDPPRATVRVTNLSTGASAEGAAQNDGSLDLVVAGSLQDSYEVTVSSDGRQTSVLLGTNASNPVGAIDSLSCQTLENTLSARLADSFATAETACLIDGDCDQVYWGVGCYYQCGSSYITRDHTPDVLSRAEQDTAAICSELAGRCVRQAPSSCPPPLPAPPACIGGTCQGLDIEQLSCEDVVARATARRDDAVTRAGGACQVDADCLALPTGVSCVLDCGPTAPVPADAAAALQQELTRIEQQLCQNFSNKSCPGFIPFLGCAPSDPAASRVPICFNNQCDFATLLP